MRGGRRGFLWTAATVVALLVTLGVVLQRGRRAAPPGGEPATPVTPPRADAAPDPGGIPADETAADDADPFAEFGGTGRRGSWTAVDLAAVRRALPDNLYWAMAAPTTDPELLRWRDAERERWNVAYGKVLSNTATDGEIDAYYAERQRISTDYVEFAGHVLAEYGETLPPRDVALLKLAIDMHLARLEEYPRQIVEAKERHAAHEAARQEWLAQQRAFDAAPPDDAGAAPAR